MSRQRETKAMRALWNSFEPISDLLFIFVASLLGSSAFYLLLKSAWNQFIKFIYSCKAHALRFDGKMK